MVSWFKIKQNNTKSIFYDFQIELAIQLNKPLFVHERDAHEDLISILDQFKTKLPAVLIHCFTGTAQQALAYLDKGFYIGLTGKLQLLTKLKKEIGNLPLFFCIVMC